MSNVDTRPWTSQLLSVQNHYFSDFGESAVGQQDDLEGAKTQKYHVNRWASSGSSHEVRGQLVSKSRLRVLNIKEIMLWL